MTKPNCVRTKTAKQNNKHRKQLHKKLKYKRCKYRTNPNHVTTQSINGESSANKYFLKKRFYRVWILVPTINFIADVVNYTA